MYDQSNGNGKITNPTGNKHHNNGSAPRLQPPPVTINTKTERVTLEYQLKLLVAVKGTQQETLVRNRIQSAFESLMDRAINFNVGDDELIQLITDYANAMKQ
jgi:hypothetical protein